MEAAARETLRAIESDLVSLQRITETSADTTEHECFKGFDDIERRIQSLVPVLGGVDAPGIDPALQRDLIATLSRHSQDEADGLLRYVGYLRRPLSATTGVVDSKAIRSAMRCLGTVQRCCMAAMTQGMARECRQVALDMFTSLWRLNQHTESQAECLSVLVALLSTIQHHMERDLVWYPPAAFECERVTDACLRVVDKNMASGQRLKSVAMQLMGKLCCVFRGDMQPRAPKVFATLMGFAKRMSLRLVTEQTVGEGLLVGLDSFLSACALDFTTSEWSAVVELHHLVKQALLVAKQARSYRVTRAALKLLANHSMLLKACLVIDAPDTSAILLALWCHGNADLHRAAYPAAAAFFQAVAMHLCTTAVSDGTQPQQNDGLVTAGNDDTAAAAVTLDRLLWQAEAIVRGDAPGASAVARNALAFALIQIGLLARPMAIFRGEGELHRVLEVLCSKCEPLLGPPGGGPEEAARLVPHFISGFAGMLMAMQAEPHPSAAVTIGSMLNATLLLYPQDFFLERMRAATAHSCFKLLLALRKHAELAAGIVRRFVRKSILLSAGTSSTVTRAAALENEDMIPVEGEGVRYCGVYLQLWVWLLDGPITVGHWGYPWSSVFSDRDIVALRRSLSQEATLAIVDIVKRLDYRLALVEGPRASRGDVARTEEVHLQSILALGEDTVSPGNPKDYALFLNLVSFVVGCVHQIVRAGAPMDDGSTGGRVVEILLGAFIGLSRQYPFVSGFYTCLAAIFRAWASAPSMRLGEGIAFTSDYAAMAHRRLAVFSGDLLLQCAVSLTEIPLRAPVADEARAEAMQTVLRLGADTPLVFDRAISVLRQWLSSDATNVSCRVVPHALDTLGKEELASIDFCRLLGQHGIGHMSSRLEDHTPPAGPELPSSLSSRQKECWTHVTRILAETHKLPIPMGDEVVELPLGRFLPRLAHLARLSKDRNARVAAAELLHATTAWLLGLVAVEWYPTVLPVIIDLAASQDNVLAELFKSLLMQCVRWLANKPEDGAQHLLAALFAGVANPTDSLARQVSSDALLELVKWSVRSGNGPHGAAQVGDPKTTSRPALPGDTRDMPSVASQVFEGVTAMVQRSPLWERLGGTIAISKLIGQVGEEIAGVVAQHVPAIAHGLLNAVRRGTDIDEDHVGVLDQLLTVAEQLVAFIGRFGDIVKAAASEPLSEDRTSGNPLGAVVRAALAATQDAALGSKARQVAQRIFIGLHRCCSRGSGGDGLAAWLDYGAGGATWQGAPAAIPGTRAAAPRCPVAGEAGSVDVNAWMVFLKELLCAMEHCQWLGSARLVDSSELFSRKRRRDAPEAGCMLWPYLTVALQQFLLWFESQDAVYHSGEHAAVHSVSLLILERLVILVRCIRSVVVRESQVLAEGVIREVAPSSLIVPVAMRLLLQPSSLRPPAWDVERVQWCGEALLAVSRDTETDVAAATRSELKDRRRSLLMAHLATACEVHLRSVLLQHRRHHSLRSLFAADPSHATALFLGLRALHSLGLWAAVLQALEASSEWMGTDVYLLREALEGYADTEFTRSEPRAMPFLRVLCQLATVSGQLTVAHVLNVVSEVHGAGRRARLSAQSASPAAEYAPARSSEIACITAFKTELTPFAAACSDELVRLCTDELVAMRQHLREHAGRGSNGNGGGPQSAHSRTLWATAPACTVLSYVLESIANTPQGSPTCPPGGHSPGESVIAHLPALLAALQQTWAVPGSGEPRSPRPLTTVAREVERARLDLSLYILDRCVAGSPSATLAHLSEHVERDVQRALGVTEWLCQPHCLLREPLAVDLIARAAKVVARLFATSAADVPVSEPCQRVAMRVSRVVVQLINDELPVNGEQELPAGSTESGNYLVLLEALVTLVGAAGVVDPMVVVGALPHLRSAAHPLSTKLARVIEALLDRQPPEALVALVDETLKLQRSPLPPDMWWALTQRVALPAIRRLPAAECAKFYTARIRGLVSEANESQRGSGAIPRRAFALIELMYRLLDGVVLKGLINAAYVGELSTGQPLTSRELVVALIKVCVRVRRTPPPAPTGPLGCRAGATRHQEEEEVLAALKLRQAAHCCLSAALMATQDQERVFMKLLLDGQGSSSGGGGLWAMVTDCARRHRFTEETTCTTTSESVAILRDAWEMARERGAAELPRVEACLTSPSTSSSPGPCPGPVAHAIHREMVTPVTSLTGGETDGLSRVASTHVRDLGFPSDPVPSSGQHLSSCLPLAEQQYGVENQAPMWQGHERSSRAESGARSVALIDVDPVWESSCCGAYLELFDFLANKFGTNPSGWVSDVVALLAAREHVPANVKLVVARLISLRPAYFTGVAPSLSGPIVEVASSPLWSPAAAPRQMHNIARDLFVMLLDWASAGALQLTLPVAQAMVDFVMHAACSDSARVTRENVELFNQLWRGVKALVALDLAEIATMLKADAARARVAIQLCGVLVDSGTALCSQERGAASAETVYHALTLWLETHLFQAAAEVIGLELRLASAAGGGRSAAREQLLMCTRSALLRQWSHCPHRVLAALRAITENDTSLVAEFAPGIVFTNFATMPLADQALVLEIVGRDPQHLAEGCFPSLLAQFSGYLPVAHDVVRIGFFTLLRHWLPHLGPKARTMLAQTFLTAATLACLEHCVESRVAFFQLCVALCDMDLGGGSARGASREVAGLMRLGVNDPFAVVRDIALDYVDQKVLAEDLIARLTQLVREGPGAAERGRAAMPSARWVQNSSILLLGMCHRHPSFEDRQGVFPVPLAQCTFRERVAFVSGSSERAARATVFSQPRVGAQLGPGIPAYARSQVEMPGRPLTETLYGRTVHGKLTVFKSAVRPTTAHSALTFTQSVVSARSTPPKWPSYPGSVDTEQAYRSSSIEADSSGLPRRLRKLPEQRKLALSMASAMRATRERHQLDEEAADVTRRSVRILSSYRDGDFPDVQRALKAFVVPLQALCLYDEPVARLFMSIVAEHCIKQVE